MNKPIVIVCFVVAAIIQVYKELPQKWVDSLERIPRFRLCSVMLSALLIGYGAYIEIQSRLEQAEYSIFVSPHRDPSPQARSRDSY